MVSGKRYTAASTADASSSAGSSYSGFPPSTKNVISSDTKHGTSPALETLLRSVGSQSVQYSIPARSVLNAQTTVIETDFQQSAQAANPGPNDNSAKGSAMGPQIHQPAHFPDPIARPTVTRTENSPTYASLLKTNRLMLGGIQLRKINNGSDIMSFDLSRVDSIESVYGPCLLGWIMGARPPPPAIHDLIRRWGGDGITFTSHISGWILFKFPSIAVKDKIKLGSKHTILGRHVFLKEMPRCFNFGCNDVHLMPTWTQIHGLAPDCWNEDFLSNIGSRIGTPIHSDAYTQARKGLKFARLLVEVDMSQPLLRSMDILIDGTNVELKFIYEHEPQTCNLCISDGKKTESCTHPAAKKRVSRGRSRTARYNNNHGRSRIPGAPPGQNNFYRARSKSRGSDSQKKDGSIPADPTNPNRESALGNGNSSDGAAAVLLGNERVEAGKETLVDSALEPSPGGGVVTASTDRVEAVNETFDDIALEPLINKPEPSSINSDEEFQLVINRKKAKKERYLANLTNRKKLSHTIPFKSKNIMLMGPKNTAPKDKGKKQMELGENSTEDHTSDLEDDSLDTEYFVEGDPTHGSFWGNIEKGRTPTSSPRF